MDDGPPDLKRIRTEGGASWSNGISQHHRAPVLPPLPPQHHSQPFSRPHYPPARHLDDRRHHEHEEPQRQPLGPPLYGGYASREPMIKMDPSEPSQQHHARPHSTGNIADTFVRPPKPEEPRRQTMAVYDNPTIQPPPQPYQTSPAYPAPSPHNYQDRQFEPPTPGSFRDPGYTDFSYTGSASSSQKKKAPRTSQACDACRAAKAKCNDPKPCSTCREKGIECKYQVPLPKQGDKVQNDILEKISTSLRVLDTLAQRMDKVDKQMQTFTKALFERVPGFEDMIATKEQSKHKEEVKEEEAYDTSQPESPMALHENATEVVDDSRDPSIEENHESQEEEVEEDNGKPVLPDELTIPIGHTTGAARLLQWRAIDNIVGARMRAEKIRCDPFTRENKRGLLRLFGRGEGPDTISHNDKDQMTDTNGEGYINDNFSEASASPSPDFVWGLVGDPSTGAGVGTLRAYDEQRTINDTDGGVLDFEKETVLRLVESYKANINNMQPVLSRPVLDRLAKNFIKTVTSTPLGSKGPSAGFVNTSKRKRSPTVSEPPELASLPYLKSNRPQRTISAAIVLLVLALGKICENRGKLPDVVIDDRRSTDSPSFSNDYTSPSHVMQNLSQHSSALASPREQERSKTFIARRRSTDILPNKAGQPMRNIDVIPGLAYFAMASDILGNQVGGTTLQHVQANLLAGLYHGQLGRVLTSYSYIFTAGYTLQMILKPKLQRFRRCLAKEETSHPTDNPLLFAFWNCLQLESDILAELDLPQSHILSLETSMPWPDFPVAVQKDGMTEREMQSYTGQLWLRKRLNYIHKSLYAPGQEEVYQLASVNKTAAESKSILFSEIQAIQDGLLDVKSIISTLDWNEDDDPPASDILGARLRAKFFGAHVILYRPFVRMVLDNPFAEPSAFVPSISPLIIDYARRGVKALIQSTSAFHGLPDDERLIITNVFGTAHAQWGNIVTLQAVYMNDLLKDCLDPNELKKLTIKTRDFLIRVAQPSSALKVDQRILEYAAQHTNMLPDDSQSSFSSTSTRSEA